MTTPKDRPCPSYQHIPHDIVNAAIKVSTLLMQQGISTWELMGVQSRAPKDKIHPHENKRLEELAEACAVSIRKMGGGPTETTWEGFGMRDAEQIILATLKLALANASKEKDKNE